VNIKFSSSPWGFRFYSFSDYCRFLKSLQMKYVCNMFGNPKELPLAFPVPLLEERVKEILNISSQNGQKIIEMGIGGDFSRPESKDEAVTLTKKQLDIAAKLGAEIFIVFAGFVPEEEATEKTYEQVSECLTEVGKYAQKYDITIAMENHGGITRTAKQVLKILEAVDSPNVGTNYDPANFFFHGEDPVAAGEVLRSHIVFSHLKGCRVIDGKSHYCRLKDAEFDYQAILRNLLENDLDYFVVEYENPDDVEGGTNDDLQFLKKQIAGILSRES